MKGIQTKGLIRKVAYKLFLTQNYNNISLYDIEKELNLSRGCIYYHYASKQKLFIDVIDYYILQRPGLEVYDRNCSTTLLGFISNYIQQVEVVMEKMNHFLLPNSSTNFNRAYMRLLLEAEKYYPEFLNCNVGNMFLSVLRKKEKSRIVAIFLF